MQTPSMRLKEIARLFQGEGAETVTWAKLLYDFNDGCFLGLIDIWTYFDRDYEGMTKSEAEQMQEKMSRAFKENDMTTFLQLLQQLPSELIDNGIGQTISGFEREHDDVDLSRSEIDELDRELHTLHSAIINGSLSLNAIVQLH